jgi:hypothetical protein
MLDPAWRDARYLTVQRLAQFEAHEAVIRQRERERERRRMQPLMPVDRERASADFDGAME